jgi:predicted ATP-grasp superfamily ATP-dependent carboligase
LGIDFDSTASRTTDVYWQRFIPGVPISAFYIADDRNCQLIGTARQWVGWPEYSVGPFQFCGAIVPARISAAIRSDLELIGTRFAELAGLRGLLGIDLIQQDGRVTVVEINPRPTATMELYERIFDRSFLEDHANVFRGIERPRIIPSGELRSAAKMILYAPQSGETPALEFWNELNENSIFPSVADHPDGGQSLEIGQPVCTILADGIGETVVLDSLLKTAERIAREFGWTADFRRFLKGSKLG